MTRGYWMPALVLALGLCGGRALAQTPPVVQPTQAAPAQATPAAPYYYQVPEILYPTPPPPVVVPVSSPSMWAELFHAMACVTQPEYLPMPKEDAPAGEVTQITPIWKPEVVYMVDACNPGKEVPCLVGDLYLFGKNPAHPVLDEGMLTVDLFDERAAVAGYPLAHLEQWRIDKTTMAKLARKDVVGDGYTLMLPWSTYRPDLTQVRIMVCYQSEKGTLPLYASSGVLTMNHSERGVRPVAQGRVSGMIAPAVCSSVANVPVCNANWTQTHLAVQHRLACELAVLARQFLGMGQYRIAEIMAERASQLDPTNYLIRNVLTTVRAVITPTFTQAQVGGSEESAHVSAIPTICSAVSDVVQSAQVNQARNQQHVEDARSPLLKRMPEPIPSKKAEEECGLNCACGALIGATLGSLGASGSNKGHCPMHTNFSTGCNSDVGLVGSVVLNERNFNVPTCRPNADACGACWWKNAAAVVRQGRRVRPVASTKPDEFRDLIVTVRDTIDRDTYHFGAGFQQDAGMVPTPCCPCPFAVTVRPPKPVKVAKPVKVCKPLKEMKPVKIMKPCEATKPVKPVKISKPGNACEASWVKMMKAWLAAKFSKPAVCSPWMSSTSFAGMVDLGNGVLAPAFNVTCYDRPATRMPLTSANPTPLVPFKPVCGDQGCVWKPRQVLAAPRCLGGVAAAEPVEDVCPLAAYCRNTGSPVRLRTPLMDIACDRIRMLGSGDRVMLEGDVTVILRREHHPAKIMTERMIVGLKDGHYELDPGTPGQVNVPVGYFTLTGEKHVPKPSKPQKETDDKKTKPVKKMKPLGCPAPIDWRGPCGFEIIW